MCQRSGPRPGHPRRQPSAPSSLVPRASVGEAAARAPVPATLLTVNSCIKVCLDLQADKSLVVVKEPFVPRVVNPRYRIRGTNV
jgi:hypothetical protein